MDRIHHSENPSIEAAKLQAQESLGIWANAARVEIDRLVGESNSFRANETNAGIQTIKSTAEASHVERAGQIGKALSEGTQKIDQSPLDSTRKQAIHAWFTDKLTAIAKNDDANERTMDERARQLSTIIKEKQGDHSRALRQNQEAARNLLNSQALQDVSINTLNNRITNQLDSLVNKISFKNDNLTSLIQTKVSSFSEYTRSHEAKLATKLAQLTSALRARIAEELAKQQRAQDEPRQHSNYHQQQSPRPTSPERSKPVDPRIQHLMGKTTSDSKQPYITLLANIDKHRAQGRSDEFIFKLLLKHFHPDVSNSTQAGAVTRVLNAAYDRDNKAFKV